MIPKQFIYLFLFISTILVLLLAYLGTLYFIVYLHVKRPILYIHILRAFDIFKQQNVHWPSSLRRQGTWSINIIYSSNLVLIVWGRWRNTARNLFHQKPALITQKDQTFTFTWARRKETPGTNIPSSTDRNLCKDNTLPPNRKTENVDSLCGQTKMWTHNLRYAVRKHTTPT